MLTVVTKTPGQYSFETLKANLAGEEAYYQEMQGYLKLQGLPPAQYRRRYNNLSLVFKIGLKRQRRHIEIARKGLNLAERLGQLAQQS